MESSVSSNKTPSPTNNNDADSLYESVDSVNDNVINCFVPPSLSNLPGVQLGVPEPELRYNPGISSYWSVAEQSILQQMLIEHANLPAFFLYAKIANKLSNKTMRDVALRVQWMKTASGRSVSQPKAFSGGHPHAEKVTPSDNDDGNSLKEKVSLTIELLNQSAEGLGKVSAKLVDLQADDEINLLSMAKKNILTAMENLKEIAP